MLNELITWVLNTYLGKYLEDFNPAQLSVALLSGEVELENVPIRKDALRSFGIPVQAFSGNIGKIKLQIPVRQFRTAPWCIIIERVYGVFGPKDPDEWDDEKEKQSDFEFKLSELDAKEAKWRVENGYQTENYYATSYTSWLNYGTTLATNILENLELRINDVHIRYEDRVTIKDTQFAAGIKISSLTAQTCDANWVPGSKIHNNQSISYKLIELKDFAVYWDRMTEQNACTNLISRDLLLNMDTKCNASEHRYIISPISARAQCKRERCRQAIRSKLRPRLSCEVLIQQVKISLSDFQYKQIVDCIAGLHLISKIRAYRIIRPTCSIRESPILWWQYAAKCHNFSYQTAEQKWLLLKENLRYIRIYKRLLLNPNDNISKEDKHFKSDMERTRKLSELQILRNVCFSNVYANDLSLKTATRNINQGKGSMLYHWFPNWWGWYGNANGSGNENALDVATSAAAADDDDEAYRNIEDDILNALEDTIENDTFSKRDVVFGYFTFILVDGQFLLNSEDSNGSARVLLEMEFQNLISLIEMKPRFSSYLIGVSLGSVCLKDRITARTEFPYLIRPQIKETPPMTKSSSTSSAAVAAAASALPYVDFKRFFTKSKKDETDEAGEEPWFQLQYEKGPLDVQSDFRLVVKSRSLDIVYNRQTFEWLVAFLTKPLSRLTKQHQSRSVKEHTNRLKFLKNWKHLLIGHKDHRKTWSFEIDIYAPRIIFVENFTEKNTPIVLVDFGRFQLLKNESRKKEETAATADSNSKANTSAENNTNSEDDELFMTPCSTPPGSEISLSESPTICHDAASNLSKFVINNDTGLESAFHNKIYDKYVINLTDLQVLVCRNRERAFASFKNSSNFHLLDKFNISLDLERRVIYTIDPEYPSITLHGTLPRIVAHVNEQRINEFLKIVYPITFDNIFKAKDVVETPSPQHTEGDMVDAAAEVTNPEEDLSESSEQDLEQNNLNTNVVIVRFQIGQMILEVQSCEKSIAELQILGARASYTKRAEDTHITMSVHGLLLVDAIQSFGPDFELLVASHRHVGMDSISGSLKQSEPCSPTSPGSPDPLGNQRPTSPHIINRAVNHLQAGIADTVFEFDEINALITIDINLIEATNDDDALQIANITFNNLDIIANQETIVELLGFINRIFYTHKTCQSETDKVLQRQSSDISSKEKSSAFAHARSEISFDFHRLNILVLRTLKKDKFFVARKVGTLTMSEAKIHATIGKDVSVTGSLGGIQIIDLTPEGVIHQRIFSVGKDPLTDPPDLHKNDLLCTLANEMYGGHNDSDGSETLSDQMNALVFKISRDKNAVVNIKIRMASVWYTHCPRFIQEINLCVSQFKHYLKIFAKSIRNKATDMAMGLVQHISDVNSLMSAERNSLKNADAGGQISMDIILNTPVLVLPRSSQSSDVLVANLGKITAYNTHEGSEISISSGGTAEQEGLNMWTKDNYFIDVRNINLFSLNTSQRKELRMSALPKANEFYSCKNDAVAILHDTAMLFKFIKDTRKTKVTNKWNSQNTLSIEGSVTEHLQVSLSREQYEQLTESLDNATKFNIASDSIDNTDAKFHVSNEHAEGHKQYEEEEDEDDDSNALKEHFKTKIQFEVPILEMGLKNEHNNSLINITFREFSIKHNENENGREMQILLQSILMEDLKCALDSKFRNMVDSSSDCDNDITFKNDNCSSSCPNLANLHLKDNKLSTSMPSKLNAHAPDFKTTSLAKSATTKKLKNAETSSAKTCKTANQNLVIYKSQIIKIKKSNGDIVEDTNSSIDFNCLNLTISVDRWFMVLDFFGLVSIDETKNVDSSKNEVEEYKTNFSELKVSVHSLNLILVRNETELSKANISHAFFKITKENIVKAVEGRLGSLSLYDLTQFGSLYREKFSTTGTEAVSFSYKRLESDTKDAGVRTLAKDAMLNIQMSSVRYIHTKRFIVEIHLFVKELLQLQTPVIKRIKLTDAQKSLNSRSIQIGLEIHAASPIILLPMSYQSNQVIIADLGEFTLNNSFHFASEECVISKKQDIELLNEILDVMHIDLININLFTGERIIRTHKSSNNYAPNDYLNVGNFTILKMGSNLFQETCHLKLQVERNTDSGLSHNCPDISVEGTLSKLNGIVNLQQYKLIRGFLNYNLGETIDDVYYNYSFNLCESIERLNSINKISQNQSIASAVWNTMSINLLLENVSILLTEKLSFEQENQALACIKFIKSALEIDSFSDGSQDIDLISQEILIMDSREDTTSTNNVYKHILKPTRTSNASRNIVQAEIHSRKRGNASKYTIMLNNMRIMAILDCLESLKNYLKEEPHMTSTITPVWQNKTLLKHQPSAQRNCQEEDTAEATTMEVVLNITDSELVFVEKVDQIDTNAIILKSTTVLSYKPNNDVVPISIDINHLEIFSCILGAEEKSALSIIDPFTLNLELRKNCFSILIQKQLCIRLSYNDVKLFTRMLQLIPKQTKTSRRRRRKKLLTHQDEHSVDFEVIAPLVAMGFSHRDCWYAMELNNYKLNDAAIWLSQQKQLNAENTLLEIHNVVLNANCISVCVIDDCMDADVPLLELSLSHLMVRQILKHRISDDISCVPYYLEGRMETVIASDYYNRRLSGWEPIIESWECSANWKYCETNSVVKAKTLDVHMTSKQLLRLNVTTTLIELYDIVRNNWTQDYYGSTTMPATSSSNALVPVSNLRRRTPFVPFALQNLTGEPLIFKTILSQPGGITRTEVNQHEMMCNWVPVQPNEVIPFDFGPQTKLRHMDSHKLNSHQILVQIQAWTLIGPISIDKVGIFFRYSTLDLQYQKRTRIVFDISLVGSAQKLITVRSALNIVNKLDKRMFLKMETRSEDKMAVAIINPNEHLSVPLRLVESLIYVKPVSTSKLNEQLCENISKDITGFVQHNKFLRSTSSLDCDDIGFSTRGISWMDCAKDSIQDLHSCYGPNKSIFHTLVEIKRDKYPIRDVGGNIPGHTITLLPPLKLRNMLCCDLVFKITGHIQGRLMASETINIHTVNAYDSFILSIILDNYKLSGQLKIPMGHSGIVEPKLKLIDTNNRELYLRVSIQSFPGRGMEIYVSAPVWIINKTGLPLVYRQEGTSHSASGQFDEHEMARVVSPLMFSFSDLEGSPSLEIRLGNSYGNNNTWCKSFNIHKEIIYRELRAERSKGCYTIGINVRRGRGLYACTTFVTLSPRFQLYNKSSRKLEFAQKCDIVRRETATTDKIISALPNCNFPFHWPNCEEEPLLCVRIVNGEFCHWSNGIPMNEVQSLYINIRNEYAEMFFLRLEVISRGATYILLFSDAHTLPPPIRIDNHSEVLIHFSQYGCKPHWRTTVRPQSSLAYALDDPMGTEGLQIEAPGGNSIEFLLNKFDVSRSVTYANFIYIAFKETFSSVISDVDNSSDMEMETQQLVLGVKDKKVIIARKCAGDRSQLWLMNSNGQLEHEGSSPPTEHAKANEYSATRMVLDLETAPNPNDYTNLVIRPPNKQRITTQTWRFENGRLMCHANMCVQARDGIFGLRPGCSAVLGRIESLTRITNSKCVPFEQCIEIQKLRPGSGHLEVISRMDGPIRTIQIRDVKAKQDNVQLNPDPSWNHASIKIKKIIDETKRNILDECSLKFELLKGLGLSVITRKPCEELAYITFENITIDILSTPFIKSIDLRVSDLQIDNQLLDTSCPVLLHTVRATSDDLPRHALILRAKVLPSPNEHAVIFEYLTFDLKPCMVYMEERHILKTAYFLGYGKFNQYSTDIESEYEAHGVEEKSFSKNSRRFYFENFSIGPSQIRLTMFTAPKLTQELTETKKAIGLTLVKFEDALIDFDKFSDKHHFETFDVYLKAIKLHYVNQIKWHAGSILGSVDFLGNPLGFANDLSEGVSGLIFEGNVKSLVKNVTHGISNSTAKLTETLSDSLGHLVLDEHDNETRQKILELQSNTSGGHLTAGLKGFGFGLLGGVTSIVRHTYVGAQSDGFPGFLSGLGKGLVGTVTKPIIGVLDLASETATAVRESSKGSHRSLPDRKRLPRCVTGAPGGLLPTYSYRQGKGQQYLYVINRRNFSEKLMSYEPSLCNDPEAKLRLLVSTEYIRIFSRCDEDPAIMFECHLSEVLSCHPLTNIGGGGGNFSAAGVVEGGVMASTSKAAAQPVYYIEISTNLPKITRPRVRCQNEETAERAARCINYSKSVFDEREQSVAND